MLELIIKNNAQKLEHAFEGFSFAPLIAAKKEEIDALILAEHEIEIAKSEIERAVNNGMCGDEFIDFVVDKLDEVHACINERKDSFDTAFVKFLHSIVNLVEKRLSA